MEEDHEMWQRLDQVLGKKTREPYEEQCRYVGQLIDSGKIKPIDTFPKNGRKPPLFLEYRVLDEKEGYAELEEELLHRTDSMISVAYYLHNPEVYIREREAVRMLNDYFKKEAIKMPEPASYGERSLEIWGDKNFISRGPGKRVLKHCGLTTGSLNCFPKAELASRRASWKNLFPVK